MWLDLEQHQRRMITLRSTQSIWPAPDGSDAELIITQDAHVAQEVVLVTPRVARLRYVIEETSATMTLGDNAPAPWPDAGAIKGRAFEIMLTERGALVVPSQGSKLPNRLASWLEHISEDIRSCWPVPPAQVGQGDQWTTMPAIPGGLPPGAISATIKLEHELTRLEDPKAEVLVRFGVIVTLEQKTPSHAQRGEGRGEVQVRLHKQYGLHKALRRSRIELVRPNAAVNQLLQNRLEVSAAAS